MAKRRSDIQLTKDNFEYDEPQTVGEVKPKTAPADVLKTRVFAKAKRQLTSNNSGDSSTKSLFGGFKGFSSFGTSTPASTFKFGSTPSTTASTAPTFSFGLNNFNNNNNNNTNSSERINFGKLNSTETMATVAQVKCEQISNENKADNSAAENDTFVSDLTTLNKIFFDHIKKYMDKNELYDFTSVCEEYISHYKKLKESIPSGNQKNAKLDVKGSAEQSKTTPSSMFKIPSFVNTSSTSLPTVTKFSLPIATENKSTEKPLFSFGNAPSFPTNQAGIFKSVINNSGLTNSGDAETNEEGGDTDDAPPPPKTTSVEHQEDDAVYTKKCKLYYKKGEQFTEKGVGFLYIKVKDKESKPQLLIRAGTSTGNILLNIALVESLPVLKADKGMGVLLTCVPNPPLETKKKTDTESAEDDLKSVTFLIRVKKEDCDELFSTITKYKSQN